MSKLIIPANELFERTFVLATAKVCELEPELCLTEAAKSPGAIGKIPAVPQLENQKDLMKLVAILLSTGINRNDDVFLPREVLPVRNTGAHKPVNLEHDPTQIIGHMLRTYVTTKAGKKVSDSKQPKDKNFDITAEAVIYKFLFPNLAKEIAERAEAGELFVSVEVWFTAYDYLVGNKIVKRTSATASTLDPKLRINGGEGLFEGQRLGRVLRNMIIGGIGVVKDPANPESVIKSVSNFGSQVVLDIEDAEVAAQVVGDLDSATSSAENQNEATKELVKQGFTQLEVDMNPEIIEEMAALAAAIQAKADAAEDTTTTFELPEEHAENEFLQQLVASVNERLTVLEDKNKETERKLAEAEYKAEASRRGQVLSEAGVPDELLDAQLALCFSMTKEAFGEYVSLLGALVSSVGTAKAEASAETSAEETTETTETTETAEGGDDSADATSEETVEASAEEAETEETTEEETQEAAAPEAADSVETDDEATEEEAETAEVTDTQDSADTADDGEDIEVDIEAVDPALNIESDKDAGKKSTVDQMAEVAVKFLERHNPKWANLVKRS